MPRKSPLHRPSSPPRSSLPTPSRWWPRRKVAASRRLAAARRSDGKRMTWSASSRFLPPLPLPPFLPSPRRRPSPSPLSSSFAGVLPLRRRPSHPSVDRHPSLPRARPRRPGPNCTSLRPPPPSPSSQARRGFTSRGRRAHARCTRVRLLTVRPLPPPPPPPKPPSAHPLARAQARPTPVKPFPPSRLFHPSPAPPSPRTLSLPPIRHPPLLPADACRIACVRAYVCVCAGRVGGADRLRRGDVPAAERDHELPLRTGLRARTHARARAHADARAHAHTPKNGHV